VYGYKNNFLFFDSLFIFPEEVEGLANTPEMIERFRYDDEIKWVPMRFDHPGFSVVEYGLSGDNTLTIRYSNGRGMTIDCPSEARTAILQTSQLKISLLCNCYPTIEYCLKRESMEEPFEVPPEGWEFSMRKDFFQHKTMNGTFWKKLA